MVMETQSTDTPVNEGPRDKIAAEKRKGVSKRGKLVTNEISVGPR